MVTKSMKAFLELAREDEELRNQLALVNAEAADVAKKKVIELAQQRNIALTEEDIDSGMEKDAALDDTSLSEVSGGFKIYLFGHPIG